MKNLIRIIFLIFTLLLIWFVYLLLHPLICPIDEDFSGVEFCGVTSKPVTTDPVFVEGKTIFRNHCSACHSRIMSTEATGPALQNTFVNWNNDTIKYQEYINSSATYLDKYDDKRIEKIKQNSKFGLNSHRNQLDLVKVKALIYYIEEESK